MVAMHVYRQKETSQPESLHTTLKVDTEQTGVDRWNWAGMTADPNQNFPLVGPVLLLQAAAGRAGEVAWGYSDCKMRGYMWISSYYSLLGANCT